jgi:cyclic pyranopterin phosphate synthase
MPSRSINPRADYYISGEEVKLRLPYDFQPADENISSAAKYFSAPNLKIRVGFINPVSHPFCSECNRIRLTADGHLYGCLFSSDSINLFELLNKSEERAIEQITKLVGSKTYIGCCGDKLSENLPSFINLGG